MLEIYMTPQEEAKTFPWLGSPDEYIEGCLVDNVAYETIINGERREIFSYEHYVNPNLSDCRIVIPESKEDEKRAWSEWDEFAYAVDRDWQDYQEWQNAQL